MSAQGGGAFSDLEIGRAVVYMANKAGAGFNVEDTRHRTCRHLT